MTTFTHAAPARRQPDRTKHVNYSYGMVLGVHDFTQEYAYLAGKDAQAIAELSGYGRVRGLSVRYQVPAGAQPQLVVAPGVAVVPGGQLVTVDRPQCANLDDWITAHRSDVEQGLGGGSPHSGTLSLVIVLSYSSCDTDLRPIPGEPCRSEDDLMAPSRTRDDFDLVLRRQAPADQRELTAAGAFVAWLRNVPVTEAGAGTLVDLLDAIRVASGVTGGADSPVPPDLATFMTGAPPSGLEIPRVRAPAWYRAAFTWWASDLLPLWRIDPDAPDTPPPGLTLATVDLDVLYDPVTDTFGTDPATPTLPGPVHQDDVPLLLGGQLLAQWLLTAPPAPTGLPVTIAAGFFDATGNAGAAPYFASNGLTATARPAPDDDTFELSFNGFDTGAHYIVTGSPVVNAAVAATHTFEAAEPSASGLPAVRVRPTTAQPADLIGFQVQIVRCP